MKQLPVWALLVLLVLTPCLGWSADTAMDNAQTQAVLEDDDFEDDFDTEFETSENQEKVSDPLYYFNYGMYVFNDKLYYYGLKPVAQGYKAVVPVPARKGLRNFFHNLMFPVRFVNNVLQADMGSAAEEVGIFVVNSTAGVLGFYEFAQNHMDMYTEDEDFGQTLGVWKVPEGCYLVLPFFGPSSFRDAVGEVGDFFLDPLHYLDTWEAALGATALDTINEVSFRIGDYEAITEASLDPYQAIKSGYIQRRRAQVDK